MNFILRKRMRSTLAALAVLGAATAIAGSFQLQHGAIGGGGGASSGGSYTLVGSVGEIGAGRSIGGSFALESGTLSIFMAVQMPDAPSLTLTRIGKQIVLLWPTSSSEFTLEYTPTLESANWVQVSEVPVTLADQHQVTLIPTGGSRFFRLKKQDTR